MLILELTSLGINHKDIITKSGDKPNNDSDLTAFTVKKHLEFWKSYYEKENKYLVL